MNAETTGTGPVLPAGDGTPAHCRGSSWGDVVCSCLLMIAFFAMVWLVLHL